MADERDLVLHRRLVVGDERALGEVYDEHAGIVYGLARRILCDPVAAEDIVQQVFLRLWLHPYDYDPARSGLRAWLSAAARHRAIDHPRRDPPHATYPTDAAAVKALPEGQRTAVVLAYYGGLSYRQVAERLGIPEGAAKSRLGVALRSIAHSLSQNGVL